MIIAWTGLPMWAGYGICHRKRSTAHAREVEERLAGMEETLARMETTLSPTSASVRSFPGPAARR